MLRQYVVPEAMVQLYYTTLTFKQAPTEGYFYVDFSQFLSGTEELLVEFDFDSGILYAVVYSCGQDGKFTAITEMSLDDLLKHKDKLQYNQSKKRLILTM